MFTAAFTTPSLLTLDAFLLPDVTSFTDFWQRGTSVEFLGTPEWAKSTLDPAFLCFASFSVQKKKEIPFYVRV